MKKWSIALVLVAGVLLAHAHGQSVKSAAPQRGRSDAFVAGELLLKFNANVSASERAQVLATKRITLLRHFDALDIELIRVPPGLSVASAVGGLRSLQHVALVQPNYLRYAVQTAPPNDPLWLDGSLWGLTRIQAQPAWNGYTRGDSSVVIASLDTGINYDHLDLAPNMWRNPQEIAGNRIDDDGNGYVDDVFGIDVVNRDADPDDDHGHGTLTAGVAAAVGNNGAGAVGVSWNSRILACKFLSSNGSGSDGGAIECFNYILGLRNRGVNIRVSSNGWGAPRGSEPAPVLQAAIDAAGTAGILNVFGAGNEASDNDASSFDPASQESASIVSVASSGPRDEKSRFTNYGANSVDLAAPGEDIVSTYLRQEYGRATGTSLAAAHVAGAVALVASLDPSLSVDGIKAILLRNVDAVPDWNGRVVSGGRLNLFRALSAVGVGGNRPPEVSIQSPAGGTLCPSTEPIQIEADASDIDGSIQRVTFFANGSPIGVATSRPFRVGWSNAPVGHHTLTAVATDDLDATGTSAPVSITVAAPNEPPTVTISAPAAATRFILPDPITILADANDPEAHMASVAFYANGLLLSTDTESPFSFTWTPAAAGVYTLTAVATDDRNATGTSAGVSITVVTNTPPTVSLTTPANGASFIAPPSISMSADAGDTDGQVTSVTFYANGNLLGVDAASPYSFVWSPVTPGNYVLTAVATDDRNASTRSSNVSITVVPNTPPSVSLTGPASGASFIYPASIPITTKAMDTDGTVSNVTLRANGSVIAVLTSSPYTFTWSNVPIGSYTLTAVATDNHGDSTTSNAVNVTVTVPPRINQAAAANGGVASASSTFTNNYLPAGAINGDRRGLNWGTSGGWNDGTANTYPDWLVVDFNGPKTIDEVDVFSLQDNYPNPVDPTPTLAFTLWGLRTFEIQSWNGSAWETIPGATVTNNTLVWRRFTFTPVTTTRIRLLINAAFNGSSRVVELEAWGTVAITGPEPAELLPRSLDASRLPGRLDPLRIDAPDRDRRRRQP